MLAEAAETMLSGIEGALSWRYLAITSESTVQEEIFSRSEKARLDSLSNARRRLQWALGRLVAKQLILDQRLTDDVSLSSIEITTSDAKGRGLPPQIQIDGKCDPLALSLSHTGRGVLAAISGEPGIRIGVDLVRTDDIRPESLAIWLTAAERARIDLSSTESVAAVWAVKEAAYKAVCIDETFAPRQIEALAVGNGWRIRYRGQPMPELNVMTTTLDSQIAAFASFRPGPNFQTPTIPD